MDKDTLASLKMCVERLDPKDQAHMISMGPNRKLRAAFLKGKIWPNNSIVTVGFFDCSDSLPRTSVQELEIQPNANSIDPLQYELDNETSVITAVKTVIMERIQPLVNIKFKFVDNVETAVIRIAFNELEGAWALVGTDAMSETNPSKPTMNLGWFDVATTIHEFGHMLGMIHEHQNPQGKPIQWDDTKVYAWAKESQGWDDKTTYENIIMKYNKNQINGSDFDPYSIMLYFFPASLTTNNIGTEENLRLSNTDVQYINSTYPNRANITRLRSKVHAKGPVSQASGDDENTNVALLVMGFLFALVIILAMFSWFRDK